MPTTLPGFQNTVHDAQRSFRYLLAALARPGIVQSLDIELSSPAGMMAATAAACLTLLDLDVKVWLQPGWKAEVKQWLLFHTGCRFVDQPEAGEFAIIYAADTCPALDSFQLGHAEYPEASTTILLQVPALAGGPSVQLQGPGILGEIESSPQVLPSFWFQWQQNTACYPLGVDVILLSDRALMGLPRTAKVSKRPTP